MVKDLMQVTRRKVRYDHIVLGVGKIYNKRVYIVA